MKLSGQRAALVRVDDKEENMAEKSFESLMAELEQVVGKLEAGESTLEESVALFEKGITLTRQCSKMLEQAQQKVTVLLQGENGEMKEEPFVRDEHVEPEQ